MNMCLQVLEKGTRLGRGAASPVREDSSSPLTLTVSLLSSS